MGHQNWFRSLKEILLNSINNIKKDSIEYEDVNYEAFNIYFDNGQKLYRLSIEVSSGIHIHLSYHSGFLKNGEKNFVTDSIMNNATHKSIKKIKLRTWFNDDLRMRKIVAFICEKINQQFEFL